MKKLAVFASGAGTNVFNLLEHFELNSNCKIVLVLTNNPNSGALKHAESFKVSHVTLPNNSIENHDELIKVLKEFEIDGIVLAGFLRKIPNEIVALYEDLIVNIHPSLLPKYGGKGMFGIYVHNAVFSNKEKETGITIHKVNEVYDEGGIIAQFFTSIEDCKSADEIQKKVQQLEKTYFPIVVEKYFSHKGN